jgi:hypothetical protein
VQVRPDATGLDLTATEELPTLPFRDLKECDSLNLIGLVPCEADSIDFQAFVVLKIEPISDLLEATGCN